LGGGQGAVIRNNWYQRDAFYASTFAFVSTENPDGTWNIRPYQLVFPFRIDESPQVLITMRQNSRTAINLEHTGACTVNYLEYSDELVKTAAALGTPFIPHDERDRAAKFDLNDDGSLVDAFQVFELSLAEMTKTDRAVYAILNLDKIFARDDEGFVPNMPITLGVHGDEFFFGESVVKHRIKIEWRPYVN
jgi:flavin reductase (DIM6/NTAB) family NADH-FMN oxidoreductase RutF